MGFHAKALTFLGLSWLILGASAFCYLGFGYLILFMDYEPNTN
jgi:hypothetical protein